jgi:hypothetical protein
MAVTQGAHMLGREIQNSFRIWNKNKVITRPVALDYA